MVLVKRRYGKVFKDYVDELLPILTSNTLVAHNLPFDEKFLSSEFWRAKISFKPINRLDTMEYFKPILKIPAKTMRYGPYKNPKLSEVIDYFKISKYEIERYTEKLFGGVTTNYHDSRFDTVAMYVAVNIQRENLHGGSTWHMRFCD